MGGEGGLGCVPHTLGGVLNMCVPPLPRASSWCLSYLEVREDRHDLNGGDARLAVVLRDLRAGHRRVSRLCVFPQNPGETPRYPGGGKKKLPPLTAFWASSNVFSMAAIWLSRSLYISSSVNCCFTDTPILGRVGGDTDTEEGIEGGQGAVPPGTPPGVPPSTHLTSGFSLETP